MSQSQFKELMDRFDAFDSRLRRVELWSAGAGAVVAFVGFLISTGNVHISIG